MIRFIFALLLTIPVLSQAETPLCEEARELIKAEGKKFVSCEGVNFKKKAISSDYQSKPTAPLVAKPSDIRLLNPDGTLGDRIYQNEVPGILNSEKSFEQDESLMNRFYRLMLAQNSSSSDASEVLSLLRSAEFFEEVRSKPEKEGSSGKCDVWSSWSLDPKISSELSRLKNGILCGNIPLTKGEIKELITAFYPYPEFTDQIRSEQFYKEGYRGNFGDYKREDANMALAALGELGGGSRMSPASVLMLAKEADRDGKNILFDLDPGKEVWNQPMEEIVDVTFEDSSESTAGYLAKDYQAVSDDQKILLTQMKKIELSLYRLALANESEQDPDLTADVTLKAICNLRRSLGQTCDDLKMIMGSGPTLSQQTAELLKLESLAAKQGRIKLSVQPIQKHKIFIRYGVEGRFADSKQMESKIRGVEYAQIGDRSVWSPPKRKLSEVCSGASVGDRMDGHNSLNPDLEKQCQLMREKKLNLPDHDVFVGTLPPKEFRVFIAEPHYPSDDLSQKKKKAFEKLMDLVKTCKVFDQGVDFLHNLKNALSTNAISESKRRELVAQYQNVKGLLDEAYVKGVIDQTLQDPKRTVSGLSALKHSLF